MAEAGVIDDSLAATLAPSAGMRNLLVNRYADIDVAIVADSIGDVLDHYAEFVAQVSRWLLHGTGSLDG